MGHCIMGGGGEVSIQSGPIMCQCVQGYKSMSREMCQKQNGFLLTCSGVVMLQQSAGSCDAVGLSTGVKHAGVNPSLGLLLYLPLCLFVFQFFSLLIVYLFS